MTNKDLVFETGHFPLRAVARPFLVKYPGTYVMVYSSSLFVKFSGKTPLTRVLSRTPSSHPSSYEREKHENKQTGLYRQNRTKITTKNKKATLIQIALYLNGIQPCVLCKTGFKIKRLTS